MTTKISNTYYEDEFLDTVDTYAAYQALNALDLVEDILLRVNVRENDLGEIEEAHGETIRLIREARDLIEVMTGDYEPGEDGGSSYWNEGGEDTNDDDDEDRE